jgi:acetylornithine deacetylase
VRLERTEMRPFTGVGMDPDHEVVRSLTRVNEQILGRKPLVTGLPAASDTMMFNLYSSTPALNFGGGSASSGRAHGPDEYIDLQQVVDTVRAIAGLVVDYCGVVSVEPAIAESVLG